MFIWVVCSVTCDLTNKFKAIFLMNIKSINTYHIRCKLEKPFGFSQWSYDQRNVLLVEITTDTGVSGWGECYGPADVIQGAIEHFYAPKILGMKALHNEQIWHLMWRASLDFSRSGIMMAAMSGIDMALWDLKGKLTGLSVSELIGGAARDVIPCYATGMYFNESSDEDLLVSLVEEAKGYAAQGFKALKIKVGRNISFDKRLINNMREALPEAILAADSNHAYDLNEAIQIAKVLEKNNYQWFEEPLSPEQNDQLAQLQNSTSVAIATGECEQTRFGFKRLINSKGVQLLQADLGYCGGISEGLKIRTLASANGINMIPHIWGTQLNLAAGVHFLATAYHEPGRMQEQPLYLEYDRTENPLRDELYSTPIKVENGYAHVPDLPGLGVIINKDKLAKFLVKETNSQC